MAFGRILILITALTLAAACSDDDVKQDAGAADAAADQQAADQQAAADQKATADQKKPADQKAADAVNTFGLEGTWAGICEKDSEGDDRLVTLTFTKTTHVHSTISHQSKDLSCKPGARTMERNIRSTYAVGAKSSSVAGARDVDHLIVSIGYKPLKSAAAAYLNSKVHCGKKDWAVGVEKTFTSVPCEPGRPSTGTKVLDIFKISGGGKTLQLGGGSVTKRPTKLAPDVYKKK